MCFTNSISSMRSQSTPLKFRGKSWSFCSYVRVFVSFLVSSQFLRMSILLPFLNGESDPGHINLYFCLCFVPHGQGKLLHFIIEQKNVINSSRKRRQVFRWLHLQQSDIIFLQETYSSTETIKRWEAGVGWERCS